MRAPGPPGRPLGYVRRVTRRPRRRRVGNPKAHGGQRGPPVAPTARRRRARARREHRVGGSQTRSTSTARPADRALWDELRIDPVEIALPAGTGFTLRAYRPARRADPDRRHRARRGRPLPGPPPGRRGRGRGRGGRDPRRGVRRPVRGGGGGRRAARAVAGATPPTAAEDEADEDEDEEDEPRATRRCRSSSATAASCCCSRRPESLVSFVRSGAPNDLSQLDSWNELSERVEPADIAPLDEDTYELDLVVENLRGGHDTWDPTAADRGRRGRP